MKAIDGDSHFMEPMDLFERYIDPAFRERTIRMLRDPESGKATMLADGKPLKLRDVDQIMGLLVAYGEKEQGLNIGNFDRYLGYSQQWQDMDERVRFLDEEGFDKQVLYPSLGIVWEGEVDDPALADALCRAYNTWAFELVASHKDRLFPAAHISIRDPELAVREIGTRREARRAHHLRLLRARARPQLRPSRIRSGVGGCRVTRSRGRHPPRLASQLHRQRVHRIRSRG